MNTLTPDQAAARLGLTRREIFQLIEGGRLRVDRKNMRIGGAQVLARDVVRVEREREAKKRRAAIAEQRTLLHLSAAIADREEWVQSMRRRGDNSWSLDRYEEKIADLRQELAQRRAQSQRRAQPPSVSEGRSSKSPRPASTEELKLRAARITARFNARVGAREGAARGPRSRPRAATAGDGTYAGRVRCEPIPQNLRNVLMGAARRAHAEGREYTTHVNRKRVRIRPDGSFIGPDGAPC